jgi:propionate CoA-transferase
MFITERAVFRLEKDGVVLVEIAPGARLKEDILDQMEFAPRVAGDLKLMDQSIFEEGPMGLRHALVT